MKKTRFLNQYRHLIIMKTLWILSTVEIYSIVFTNDEQFFENNDFEDDSDISSVLIEKMKSNCDNSNKLVLFNEEIV